MVYDSVRQRYNFHWVGNFLCYATTHPPICSQVTLDHLLPFVWRLAGRQVKAPSGIIGKRPCLAKSWPRPFWSQILGRMYQRGKTKQRPEAKQHVRNNPTKEQGNDEHNRKGERDHGGGSGRKGGTRPKIWLQKAPGQALAQNGRFPMIPEEKFNSRPKGPQMAEICFQKAPGQDLVQNGRFPMIPEGDFNSRPRGRQMPEICFQKAPGQDLAQKGRFLMILEGDFNSRPRGRQMPEICFQKAPGQDLAQKGSKGPLPNEPRREILIAGRGVAKCQKFASKRLLARIWPKRTVS